MKTTRLRLPGKQCVYCGETTSLEDCFPPIIYSVYGWLLPSCRECKDLVSIHWPDNFEARSKYLKEQLRIKYKNLLQSPDWSKEEITELGQTLRSEVTSWQLKRDKLLRRIAWNAPRYLKCIDHTKSFVVIFVEINFLEMLENLN